MSDPAGDAGIGVIVALDPERPTGAAVRAALALAGGQPLRLQGLYVQEEDLLKLGGIPGLAEIEFATGLARQLSAELIEEALRTRADLVRRAFLAAAAGSGVPHSFTVVRGRLLDELIRASAAAQLLVIGLGAERFGRRHWLHRHLGRLLERWTLDLAVVREQAGPGRAVVAVAGSAPAFGNVSAIAARIARTERLDQLLLTARGAAAGTLISTSAVRHRTLRRFHAEEVAEVLWVERASAVILSRSDPALSRRFIERLVETAPCTVMLLGSAD